MTHIQSLDFPYPGCTKSAVMCVHVPILHQKCRHVCTRPHTAPKVPSCVYTSPYCTKSAVLCVHVPILHQKCRPVCTRPHTAPKVPSCVYTSPYCTKSAVMCVHVPILHLHGTCTYPVCTDTKTALIISDANIGLHWLPDFGVVDKARPLSFSNVSA